MDKIDIITFTETQYALLSRGQLQEVKTAQQKKNRLERIFFANLRKERHKLVKNGLYNSELYQLIETRLFEEYEQQVEWIKDNLLFYLRYTMKPSSSDSVTVEAPYTVDYSLSDSERLEMVRNYYNNRYPTAQGRFDAFAADTIAPQYLGELYAPLYNSYWSATQ